LAFSCSFSFMISDPNHFCVNSDNVIA
jgi:hypothetical protein